MGSRGAPSAHELSCAPALCSHQFLGKPKAQTPHKTPSEGSIPPHRDARQPFLLGSPSSSPEKNPELPLSKQVKKCILRCRISGCFLKTWLFTTGNLQFGEFLMGFPTASVTCETLLRWKGCVKPLTCGFTYPCFTDLAIQMFVHRGKKGKSNKEMVRSKTNLFKSCG